MKYKNNATDETKMLVGKSIIMWEEDDKGKPKLPVGDPMPISYKYI